MESPSALPSALTGVMNYSHVCQLCEQFITLDVSDELKWGGAEFMHYSTGTELKTSAQGRCHLCILLVQALENSRRPTTDTELPERQILLRYLVPTLDHEYFRIDVHVQPESIATAGKHDHGAFTDVTTMQGYGQKFREDGPPPSWSWAGVAGNIKYFHLFPEENDEDLKTNLKVLECKADPSDPSTISLTYSGTLQLEGFFKEAEPCLWDDKLEYPLIQWGTPASTDDIIEECKGKLRALNEFLCDEFPFATREVSTAQLSDFGIPNNPKPPKVVSDGDDGFSTKDYTPAEYAGKGLRSVSTADRLDAAGEPVKGHSLRDPVSGVQVGFWAPDVIETNQAQECKPNPITFLALCKKTEYVFALGIVPIAPGSKQYRRLGLGIWNWLAFHCSGGTPKEGTVEII